MKKGTNKYQCDGSEKEVLKLCYQMMIEARKEMLVRNLKIVSLAELWKGSPWKYKPVKQNFIARIISSMKKDLWYRFGRR